MKLRFYRKHPEAILPTRAYDDAAGYDLHSCLKTESGRDSNVYLLPHMTKAIPTGLVLQAPAGHYLAICSRSGLALHDPAIFVANAPGIIDPDYTGEIKVILYNAGNDIYTIRHGERIAQVLIRPLVVLDLEELNHPPEADDPINQRGDRGMGSTGL